MNDERRRPAEPADDELVDEERASRELAAFTDALLEGELDPTEERPPLADVVALLARTLEPEPFPERLRRRVRQSIRAAWSDPEEQPPVTQRLARLLRRQRLVRICAAAALLLVALAGALLVRTDLPGMVGTAAGGGGWVVLAAVLTLAGILAAVWWVLRRGV
jgi:hypothetical protein